MYMYLKLNLIIGDMEIVPYKYSSLSAYHSRVNTAGNKQKTKQEKQFSAYMHWTEDSLGNDTVKSKILNEFRDKSYQLRLGDRNSWALLLSCISKLE